MKSGAERTTQSSFCWRCFSLRSEHQVYDQERPASMFSKGWNSNKYLNIIKKEEEESLFTARQRAGRGQLLESLSAVSTEI